MNRISRGIVESMEAFGIDAAGRTAAGLLLGRAALLGSALYLMLGEDPYTNLKLNGVAYIVAVIWVYYDGILAKRRWSTAWLEAAFLHLAVVQVGNLLALIFGSPVIAE